MGMGWKTVKGGVWDTRVCKCGSGKVITYVSDHEESDYPPFQRGDSYTKDVNCPNSCE